LGLSPADISHDWVTGVFRARVGGSAEVETFSLTELGDSQGVISRYERSTHEAIIGHRVLTIHGAVRGESRIERVVLKAKAPGSVIRRRLEEVYRKLDPRLADLQLELSPSILDECHLREPRIYELGHASLKAITPAIDRVWIDPSREIFVVAMELLADVRHAKTLDDLDVWLPADIACALEGIARMHGELLGTIDATAPPPWLLPFERLNNAPLLAYEAALLRYNAESFPDLFDAPRTRMLEQRVAAAPQRHREILNRPLTLAHGDFTPRNICLRPTQRLCAYDWELAQVHLPQRDVCELLCYVLNPNRGWEHEATARLLDGYRAALGHAAGRVIAVDEFRHDLALAIGEFATFKLLVQGITHKILGNRSYFERMVENAFASMKAIT